MAGSGAIGYQDFLSGHGYLVSNLFGLPGVVLFIVFAGRHRASVIAAGAIESLHSFPLVWFNGTYWTPPRLGGLSWGIEDILVCFSLGVGVWFFAILPARTHLTVRFELRRFAIRLTAIAVPSAGLALFVWSLGTGVMDTLLIVMAGTGAVLAYVKPSLLRLSTAAVCFYPPYYMAVLFCTSAVLPDFFSIWNGPELWGVDIFGLPVEEFVFVVVFAAVYPLIVGTAFEAEIDRSIGANGNPV